MWKEPLPHSIYDDLVRGTFSRWLAPPSWSWSHMACIESILVASSGVSHLAFTGGDSAPSQDEKTLQGLCPVPQAGCSQGIISYVSVSHLAIWDCSPVSCGSCINPYMLFHWAVFKAKDTAPKWVTLIILFSITLPSPQRTHGPEKANSSTASALI